MIVVSPKMLLFVPLIVVAPVEDILIVLVELTLIPVPRTEVAPVEDILMSDPLITEVIPVDDILIVPVELILIVPAVKLFVPPTADKLFTPVRAVAVNAADVNVDDTVAAPVIATVVAFRLIFDPLTVVIPVEDILIVSAELTLIPVPRTEVSPVEDILMADPLTEVTPADDILIVPVELTLIPDPRTEVSPVEDILMADPLTEVTPADDILIVPVEDILIVSAVKLFVPPTADKLFVPDPAVIVAAFKTFNVPINVVPAPTIKFFPIPTPPATLNAPVVVLVASIVLPIPIDLATDNPPRALNAPNDTLLASESITEFNKIESVVITPELYIVLQLRSPPIPTPPLT